MVVMSWSDDMRCLYCDGKLPLYRKIASGQFCSAGHRRQYWKEQERLAVERLSQTHDSLRAYRPEGAATALDAALAANPSHLESLEREAAVQDFARTSSNRDQVVEAGFLRSVFPVASDWTSIAIAPTPVDFIVPERAAVAAAGVSSLSGSCFSPGFARGPSPNGVVRRSVCRPRATGVSNGACRDEERFVTR